MAITKGTLVRGGSFLLNLLNLIPRGGYSDLTPLEGPWPDARRSCSLDITMSATFLKASSSSSTEPPRAVLAKLMELPTYTGSCVFLAKSFARRVVNSNVGSTVHNGVDKG